MVTEANNHGEDCGRAGLRQSLAIARSASRSSASAATRRGRSPRTGPWRTASGSRSSRPPRCWTPTCSRRGRPPRTSPAWRRRTPSASSSPRCSGPAGPPTRWPSTCTGGPRPSSARTRCSSRWPGRWSGGADVVVGAHAHVQLGAGYLGSALVDYGLGNLAFYDTTPPETDSGTLIVKVTGRRIDGYRWRPAMIESGLPVADRAGRRGGPAPVAGAARLHRPGRPPGRQPGHQAQRDRPFRRPRLLAAGRPARRRALATFRPATSPGRRACRRALAGAPVRRALSGAPGRAQPVRPGRPGTTGNGVPPGGCEIAGPMRAAQEWPGARCLGWLHALPGAVDVAVAGARWLPGLGGALVPGGLVPWAARWSRAAAVRCPLVMALNRLCTVR